MLDKAAGQTKHLRRLTFVIGYIYERINGTRFDMSTRTQRFKK